jgi:3-oxoacyl-[acyl-carrier protein] reductase
VGEDRPVALVTGGTRGIGLGIARALARAGWDLALSGLRSAAEVASVIDELAGMGADVHYCSADVTRHDDRARLIECVEQRFASLNSLVNNAGRAGVRADLLAGTEESFEDVLKTNLQGPYFLTQRVARLLLDGKRAAPKGPRSIVFITSVSAAMASVNRGEYCVSKAGLAMAASLFAVRLAADGISVYDVRPGVVATDMTAAVKEVYDERIAAGLIPEGRWVRRTTWAASWRLWLTETSRTQPGR